MNKSNQNIQRNSIKFDKKESTDKSLPMLSNNTKTYNKDESQEREKSQNEEKELMVLCVFNLVLVLIDLIFLFA